MSRERRCWTPQEDELLREAVAEEDPDNPNPSRWHAIAMHVPNRSNKDCRKRWISKMASNVSKGVWAPDEDERLVAAVQKYGARWAMVATMVQTRNSDQCAKRWMDTLDPSIDRTSWTAEADAMLLYAVECHGKSWAKIVRTYFPGRTGLAAKNRYNSITRSRGDRHPRTTVPLFDPMVYPKTSAPASSSSSSPSPTLSMPRLPVPSPPLTKPVVQQTNNSSNLYFDDGLSHEQWQTTFSDDPSYSSESWMRSTDHLWAGDNLFQPQQARAPSSTSYPYTTSHRLPSRTSSGLTAPNPSMPQNHTWAPLDPRVGSKNFGLYQM